MSHDSSCSCRARLLVAPCTQARNFGPEFLFSSCYSPPTESSEVEGGGAVWLGSGGQIIRPCSSNFMPKLRPILVSISLISLSDLRPKFFVFSILFSLFCTSSPIV